MGSVSRSRITLSTIFIIILLLQGCAVRNFHNVERYYHDVDSVLTKFDAKLNALVAESGSLPQESRVDAFGRGLGKITEETIAELTETKPPPVLLEAHSTNLASWRRGLSNPATLEYHCAGEHCYCIGDDDCNRMFEEACERESPDDVCDTTLGFPICKCQRFLCC